VNLDGALLGSSLAGGQGGCGSAQNRYQRLLQLGHGYLLLKVRLRVSSTRVPVRHFVVGNASLRKPQRGACKTGKARFAQKQFGAGAAVAHNPTIPKFKELPP
jgi:hypothetical protein